MSRWNSSLPSRSGVDDRASDDREDTRPHANAAGPGIDQEPSRSESRPQEVRIRTGARLHFGLLDTVPPFGGAGVMIEDPPTAVTVTADDHTGGHDHVGCHGDLRPRVDPIARRVAARRPNGPPFGARVHLIDGPPRHSGFGSGTQFSLAVAEALCRIAAIAPDPSELAIELADRGRRSAVGIHGYFVGGLICEMPDGNDRLNPVHARVELPADWRVALFYPRCSRPRVSGQLERDNFAAIEAAPADRRDTLQRLLGRRLIPAAREGVFDDFGDAVTEYNRLSGELFASVQGGPFNGREVADLVAWLIDRGARGVGQSSWGPGVFAWFPSDEDAERLRRSLPDHAPVMTVTRPRNRPRDLRLWTDA